MNQALRPKPEDGLSHYSVSKLNEAVGVLLQRGFAPRFLLDATVTTKPVVRRGGHLWMSLGDGNASIEAVAWASTLRQLDYEPSNGEGVNVTGTLNFWNVRAQLKVEIRDIRPRRAPEALNQALRPKPEDGLPGLGLRFRPDGHQGLPRYSVSALNEAVGVLLQRGFARRFLLDATVTKPSASRRGHLWMNLGDGDASIEAMVWASVRRQFDYEPGNGDGVNVIGKLNFWNVRALLKVEILDIRPSLATVLPRFQEVHRRLEPEGLFELGRKRMLPFLPAHLVILTSVPSSALADMLRTARERWPATRLTVVPISVQGRAEQQVVAALQAVSGQAGRRGFEALVLARGGGSRDDLALFDSEGVARAIAGCCIPVVTGIGHEDDTTIADLVADYRAATPTAALVALLPERQLELRELGDLRQRMGLQLQQRLGLARRRMAMARRMVSSAFAIACLGILVTLNGYPLVGTLIVVFAGSAAALWFSYYRGLKH